MIADKFEKLRTHPRVADVESEGMEEGRFFVHLRSEWSFTYDPQNPTATRSFNNVRAALGAVNRAKKRHD